MFAVGQRGSRLPSGMPRSVPILRLLSLATGQDRRELCSRSRGFSALHRFFFLLLFKSGSKLEDQGNPVARTVNRSVLEGHDRAHGWLLPD